MAYNVSKKFRELVYSGDSLYKCKLLISGQEVPVRQIESIKISSPIIDSSNNTFYVGTFISQSLTIKFKNLDGINIKSGNYVSLDIGREIDGEIEYVPIGKYLIDDLAENYFTTCEITCLDYAVMFKPNIDYSPAFNESGLVKIDDLLRFICEYFGVELGDFPETNGEVEIGTYDNSLSGKLYISYIAEIKGCNAKMGRDGKLYLIPLKSPPVATINALRSKSWELREKYEITNVIYEDAVRKFAYGDDEELQEAGFKENTLYIRSDNMFVTEGSVVENIYEAVKDFKIYSLKCENYGDISLDSWDIIRYQLGEDENGNPIYYDTLNDNTINYAMTIMSTVDTKIPTAQQESLVNNVGGDDSTKLRIMKATINQMTGNIELLTATTTKMSDDLNNNYYDKLNINQLIQNAETGVTNTFSEAGGNNVFRNTGLWFENSAEDRGINPYEFWIGNIKKGTNDNATGYNSILLQNGIVYQDQVVPNGDYAISFYYKKLSPVAQASVTINDETYELTETEKYIQFYTGEQDSDGNYITNPIKVTSNHIKITFNCNVENGVEIYDLMCNKGTIKLAYSQNENETTTDTVNISKGITITSTDKNVKFKADADGIRTLDKDTNQVKTRFTDKGMTTKQAIVEDEAQICGTLVQEVSEQTWFTRM